MTSHSTFSPCLTDSADALEGGEGVGGRE